MTPSEEYVQRLFRERYSIHLTKIAENRGREGKTADFEYVVESKRVFVCELKDFEIILPSEEAGWKITPLSNGSIEATRRSNSVNRISGRIEQAYAQLSKYPEPKALIFLNSAGNLDVSDLEETFKGFHILYDDGNTRYIDTNAMRASEGSIKEIKTKIDLYIWIDPASTRVGVEDDQVFFRSATEIGRKIAYEHFGIPE